MPSVTATAIIGGAASLGSAAIGSSAAGDAAAAQTQAAQIAANTQLSMYNTTRSDLMPYQSAGNSAFTQLANLFGFGGASTGAAGSSGVPNSAAMTTALTNTPGYQFTLGQGTQALDRSAASKGLVLSGAQLKDAQSYGQGLAMNNAWMPYVQQLDSAASLGESAAAQTGNAGTSAAAGAAQSQLAAGQSTAAGIVGGANQLTSGISGLSSQLLSSYGGIGGSGFNGSSIPAGYTYGDAAASFTPTTDIPAF